MPLLCMGREIAIVLVGGREIAPPVRSGMLHDASGTDWPKCSLLISSFRGFTHEPTTRERSDARDYFGKRTPIGAGTIDLPPRSLSAWSRVGEASEIFYDRVGDKAPGYFRHRFHKPRGLWRLFFFFKRAAKLPVVLYRLSGQRVFRLDLPEGCIIDDRGIALP